MKKAQSAMEYLMTYGWAILIVIIVAAALFALGVFSPSTYTGRAATGFAGLGTPSQWIYNASDDLFQVMLTNQVGQGITVSSVASTGCTSNTTSTDISAGSEAEFTLDNCAAKGPGDSYSQSVTVTYTIAGQTYPVTTSGTLTGSAV